MKKLEFRTPPPPANPTKKLPILIKKTYSVISDEECFGTSLFVDGKESISIPDRITLTEGRHVLTAYYKNKKFRKIINVTKNDKRESITILLKEFKPV